MPGLYLGRHTGYTEILFPWYSPVPVAEYLEWIMVLFFMDNFHLISNQQFLHRRSAVSRTDSVIGYSMGMLWT
jgi:hypothetical protein